MFHLISQIRVPKQTLYIALKTLTARYTAQATTFTVNFFLYSISFLGLFTKAELYAKDKAHIFLVTLLILLGISPRSFLYMASFALLLFSSTHSQWKIARP